MFREAKTVCDRLIVALQDDPTVDRPGKLKPVQTWEERKEVIEAIRWVDEVVYYNTEADLLKLLETVEFDIRILGADYIGKDFTGDHLDKGYYFCRRRHSYSLTDLKKKIHASVSR